jgi:hypothetical protein
MRRLHNLQLSQYFLQQLFAFLQRQLEFVVLCASDFQQKFTMVLGKDVPDQLSFSFRHIDIHCSS